MQLLTACSLVLLLLQPYIKPSEATSPYPVILPDDGCHCNRTFIRPVCSNNSFTYGNECQLNCECQARIKRGQSPIVVSFYGECPREGCICPAAVIPVCGTDGITYENECRLQCNSDKQVRLGLSPIYVRSRGECPSECSRKCPIDFIPSCGSDGVTYSSRCLILCKNIERARLGLPPLLIYPGACPVKCLCPAVVQPVCGTDGVTYNSECLLNCESRRRQSLGLPGIRVKSRGRCPNVPCICPKILRPVCGTDGVTYDNECLLNCESRRRQYLGLPGIRVKSIGRCPNVPCICPAIIKPVCGTDGVTYNNECLLLCESRRRQQSGIPGIQVKSQGRCPDNPCICSLIVLPVCGTNGVSYNNECELNCASRRQQSNGGRPIFVAYWGRCRPPCNCSPTVQLVCGTDRRTYWNVCYLNCASFNSIQNGGAAIFLRNIGSC